MSIDKKEAKPVWRSLKNMYEHYLARPHYEEGESAGELIRSYREELRLRRSFFHIGNALPRPKPRSELLLLEQEKNLDKKIEKIRTYVQRRMLADASNAKWLAVGRRGLDDDHELIPPRYWAFLDLDTDQGAVKGEGLSYRDLRCAITIEIPKDDSILDTLRAEQEPEHVNGAPAHKRGPGRPSKMDFVEDLFTRRCETGHLELSLRQECAALAARFKAAHPKERPIATGTIANNLRHKYKAAIAAASQKHPKL